MGIAHNVLHTTPLAQERIEECLNNIFSTRFTPPPELNLVEWADEFRYLPPNSAEDGKWRTSRVEVARQPMLSISDDTVREVTIMSCIQLMKTELMINTAMYYMHQEPSPIMYVAPKQAIAEAWSKERLNNSVNYTPVLKDIFATNRRGEGNTILQKQFPGGQISIVSARNPDDLAMRACRIMLFDECDKYLINVGAGEGGSGGEGDAIAVAWGRATTYGDRAKKIVACSPTVRGQSRIEQEYLKSNQSVYFQKCRHCGGSQELTWSDVVIPVSENTGEYLTSKAYIVCKSCDAHWNEGDRMFSVSNGHWVAKKPEVTHHHGYKVSSLASPFTKLRTLAREYVDAFGNPQLLKVFYNTRMAETWQEDGEQPDWQDLYDHNRETYPLYQIQTGAAMVTMGVDIQKDGAWYETTAWGRRFENWSIDMGFIEGDIEDSEFREKLKTLFNTVYEHVDGIRTMPNMVCVDSGYKTHAVYALVRECGEERVRAVKGDKESAMSQMVATPKYVDVNYAGERHNRGLKLWKVGSSMLKTQLYSWFGLKRPSEEDLESGVKFPQGYCHFPEYGEDYFKQLTAEIKINGQDKRGYAVEQWHKLRKDNHLLDCKAYARAGAYMLGADRMSDSDWQSRELLFRPAKVDSTAIKSDNESNSKRIVSSRATNSKFKYSRGNRK
tara:strand:+ start:1304 stop:3310 length:2007 start_codon:yes stop_codon:yes gene_type:complete